MDSSVSSIQAESPVLARIAVLVTMDTKSQPAESLVQWLRDYGREPLIIDVSVGEWKPPSPGVIGAAEVAAEAGSDWDRVHAASRDAAMAVMAQGAISLLGKMDGRGELAGVVGLGGGSGAWLAQAIMRGLAFELPKLVVSTSVRNDGQQSDVIFMASSVDIEGRNTLLDFTLRRAAATICALAGLYPHPSGPSSNTIAMSMFGVTTEGGSLVRSLLQEAGFEVAVFHANGTGGREMERLIAAKHFVGVVDWTTTEVIDHVAGGLCDAGPTRLQAAVSGRIPLVVVPGAIDVINTDGSSSKFGKDRTFFEHLPTVLLVRSNNAENRAAGHFMGHRLRGADPELTRVLIPEGGYSALDAPGQPFQDAEANHAFVKALAEELGGHIEIEMRPEHINSRAFAELTATTVLRLIHVAGVSQSREESAMQNASHGQGKSER